MLPLETVKILEKEVLHRQGHFRISVRIQDRITRCVQQGFGLVAKFTRKTGVTRNVGDDIPLIVTEQSDRSLRQVSATRSAVRP